MTQFRKHSNCLKNNLPIKRAQMTYQHNNSMTTNVLAVIFCVLLVNKILKYHKIYNFAQ